MPVQSSSSNNVIVNRNINLKDKTNPNSNNKGALRENILDVKNSIENISPPILYSQNTYSDEIPIKSEGLKSSIINMSSFHITGLSLSKDSSDKFLAPNPDKETTRGQSKLNGIKLGKKAEIPKISAAQIADLSNIKKEDTPVNTPVNNPVKEGAGNSTRNIVYEKIQERYELNGNKFSHVLNLIKDEKISTQEKEKKLKSYLLSNDSSMKKIGKLERIKNIFGMSNKINTIRNEQREHTVAILANLNKNNNV